MKILIINHNGGSVYHGPNLRTYYAAKELVKLGHEVTIASSSYSHKYTSLPTIQDEITPEIIDGIHYRWVRCIRYANIVERIYSHFQYGVKCIRYLDEIADGADVVLFSGPPPEIFMFAKIIARKFGATIVSDIRDLWPRTQLEMSGWQWLNPFTYFLFLSQFLLARYSDSLVSPLPGISPYMRRVGAKSDTTVIENGFDTDGAQLVRNVSIRIKSCNRALGLTFEEDVLVSDIRDKYSFIVGYAGAFDRDNDIDAFMKAAEKLKARKDILFFMIGAGVRNDEVEQNANILPNLVVAERVNSIDVPSILDVMDVCFCGLKPKRIYQYGVSLAKSYEYMAARKPVIWMVDACNNPIDESGGGWSVSPGNITELVKVIKRAAGMARRERERMGDSARAYLERKHSYRVLGMQWQALLYSTKRLD